MRSHAVSGLLIAGVIVTSTGCGLIDKDDDKDDDKADKGAASTAPSVPGAGESAPADASPESGDPAPAAPGGGSADVSGKDYCSLITPAELSAAAGVEVTRTKNDTTLNVCRYYAPGDKPLLDVQFFRHSQGLGDTPESVVAKNSVAEFGEPVTDLGAFPTLYIKGGGSYPAPSTPEYYFAKTRGAELIVDVHVRVQPQFKGMERAKHTAIAKRIAENV